MLQRFGVEWLRFRVTENFGVKGYLQGLRVWGSRGAGVKGYLQGLYRSPRIFE